LGGVGGNAYDPGFRKREGFLLLFVVFGFDKLLRIEQIWDIGFVLARWCW